MERLRAILPFDSGVWASGIHSTNTLLNVTTVDLKPEVLGDYALNWQAHDFVRDAAVARPGVAFRNEDVMPLTAYHRTAIYREYSSPAGFEHELCTVQADPITDVGELISFLRGDPSAAFTDQERALAELLTPHLAAAWRQRQIAYYYEAAAGAAPIRAVGVGAEAVIDDTGLIHAAADAFSLAVRGGFPQWAGPGIPAAVMAVFSAPDRVLTVGGLDFSLVRGEQRHVLTVARADRNDRLTRAELRVARLFAEGRTHSQIAERLGVSQSTIRNQIAAIYRKLDIHSKAELARMVPRGGG